MSQTLSARLRRMAKDGASKRQLMAVAMERCSSENSARVMVHLITSLPRSIRVPTPKKWVALAESMGMEPIGLLRKVMQVLLDEPHLIHNILDGDEQ